MKAPPLRPDQFRTRAIILVATALALVWAWIPHHVAMPFPGPTACAFRQLTGLPCALCGGTRSAHALLHGDFERAARLNAVAIPALLILGVVAVIASIELAGRHSLANWGKLGRPWRRWIPFLIAFLLLWWGWQIRAALDGSKPELIDLRNPIAHFLQEKLGSAGK